VTTTVQTNTQLQQFVSQDSLMGYVLSGRGLIYKRGFVPPHVPVKTTDAGEIACLKVAFDLGNWQSKISIIQKDTYRMLCTQLPTTFQVAQTLTSGVHPITYELISDTRFPASAMTTTERQRRARGENIFPLDTYIINKSGALGVEDTLPLGATQNRLVDRRYRLYFWGAIVNALAQTGYKAGEYNIVLALGVRNEEMYLDANSTPQMRKAVREVVETYRGTTVTLDRISAKGKKQGQAATDRYILHIVEIIPYAQTLGTFSAWYYSLDGNPIQERINRVYIYDFGGGDTHVMEIDCSDPDEPRSHGVRIAPGTVEFANALAREIKSAFPVAGELTVAEAQEALMKGRVSVAGIYQDIQHLVQKVILERGANMLGRVFTANTDSGRNAFYLITGGGILLPNFKHMLAQKLTDLGRKEYESFLCVPNALTTRLNADGGNGILDALYRTVEGSDDTGSR